VTRSLVALLGLALLSAGHRMAVARFDFQPHALLPASRVALRLSGIGTPQTFAVVGSGEIENGYYVVPSTAPPGVSTLVAAGLGALAVRTLRIAAPPHAPVIAVASYDDGIVFHDPRTFAILGTLGTGGSPSDVTGFGDGFATTDTDGDTLTEVTLAPWRALRVSGILLGDEVLADPPLHAIFASERGSGAQGGLARVDSHGVTDISTGTAEGLALDPRRQRIFVADVDRGDVAMVDARTMRVIERIRDIPRAFGVAISPNGERLYAVSNQGRHTILAAPGGIVEIALYPHRRVVARSAELVFPVGIALDSRRKLLFATDEQAGVVDVLDARTLRARHAPLRTCSIPWKPFLDAAAHRLYIPCAGSDEVDVIDTRTLSRVRGAPFHTGGYPLAVASLR
jgi:DNA-binding beta-propeller fold protein YncE